MDRCTLNEGQARDKVQEQAWLSAWRKGQCVICMKMLCGLAHLASPEKVPRDPVPGALRPLVSEASLWLRIPPR